MFPVPIAMLQSRHVAHPVPCMPTLIAMILFVCMAQAETAPDPAAAEALSPSVLNRLLCALLYQSLTVAALARPGLVMVLVLFHFNECKNYDSTHLF